MAKDKEIFQQAQQGTGSAEQTGRDRDAQKNSDERLSQREKQDIAAKTGEKQRDIRTIGETGGLSGRDDYAGGDNNGMRNESTGEPTER